MSSSRWFRIHLSTAVMLTLAMGGMMYQNTRISSHRRAEGMVGYTYTYEMGWPLVMYSAVWAVGVGKEVKPPRESTISFKDIFEPGLPHVDEPKVNYLGILGNILFAIAAMGSFAIILEKRLKKNP